MSEYARKLRDPRWQRRRLERMQVADFACEQCRAKDKTLAVHHRRYFKGRDPWDYPDELLHVLCEDCHACEHAMRSALYDALAEMGGEEISYLLGVAKGKIAARLARYEEQMDRVFEFACLDEARGFVSQMPVLPRSKSLLAEMLMEEQLGVTVHQVARAYWKAADGWR